MPHPLANPFRPRSKPSKTEAEVIGNFLGVEARVEFEKLGHKDQAFDDDDFEITDEEREEMKRLKREVNALERNGKWTKKRYVMWAKSFDEDEGWVDEHFKFQPDGTTVTPGNIDLSGKSLTELPKGWIRVDGYCSLSNNQLTSLAGAPESVGGDFSCYNNQLTSLAGAPESVGGDFICDNNQLTSLDDLPEKICGYISTEGNPLTLEVLERAARKRWGEN